MTAFDFEDTENAARIPISSKCLPVDISCCAKRSQGLRQVNENNSSIAPEARIHSPDLLEHPVAIGRYAEIHKNSSIGAFGFVNIATVIYANVHIGRYTSIARNCEIGVACHPVSTLTTHSMQYSVSAFPNVEGYGEIQHGHHDEHPETTIGSDVWIGAQSIVLAGVTIGHGAIIGANAVVTRSVEPYTIVAGVPARFIGARFEPEICRKLLSARWWERDFDLVKKLPLNDVLACLSILEGEPDCHPSQDSASRCGIERT